MARTGQGLCRLPCPRRSAARGCHARVGRGGHQRGRVRRRRRLRRADQHRRGRGRHRRLRDQGQRQRQHLHDPGRHDDRGRRLLRRRRATWASAWAPSDSARLFAPARPRHLVDSYSWTSHARRDLRPLPRRHRPDDVDQQPHPRRGERLSGAPASPRPGRAAARSRSPTASACSAPNLSGLAYQPSGSGAPGVLWAVRNGPSTLYRLVYDGTKWTPDTANGWSAGKQLRYADGAGAPDAEGVTLAGGDPNGGLRGHRAQRRRRRHQSPRGAALRRLVRGRRPSPRPTTGT